MVDKEMLEAIGQMIDTKLSQQNEVIDAKFFHQKAEILAETTHNMNILLETKVQTQFNLLAEGQRAILERLAPKEDVEQLNDRVDTMESVVKKHSFDIAELRKAN